MVGLFPDPPAPETVYERYAREREEIDKLFPPSSEPMELSFTAVLLCQEKTPLQKAQDARQAAIARVAVSSDPDWLARAYGAVEAIPGGVTFTTDDLWDALPAAYASREPRAMGAVIRRAMQDKLIASTPAYRESRRTVCHARPVRVWVRL